jgi:hypothetical protein
MSRADRMPPAGLAERLAAEGLSPGSWGNGPGDVYGTHAHGYDKVLVCTAGDIVFGLPGRGERVRLGVGEHDAVVGPAGVTCLEAHLPAGHLPSVPVRRAAGTW